MNKLTRISTLSMILVVAVAGTAFATPHSTDIQDRNTLHRSIGSLWISSQTLEVCLTTDVLRVEKGKMEPGADHPTRTTSPVTRHLQSDDTKLYPPADLTCDLSPGFAVGILDRETV